MPATVDSAAVAGVMDLLRCKGSWFHAVRFAFLMEGGVNHGEITNLEYPVPKMADFQKLADAFQVNLRDRSGLSKNIVFRYLGYARTIKRGLELNRVHVSFIQALDPRMNLNFSLFGL